MIRYTLLCENEHGFDSWFRDGAAFETLAATRQVTCPACGSTAVRKALMSPAVVTSRGRARPASQDATLPATEEATPPTPPTPQPVALMDEHGRQLRAMMREIHRRVTATADNVGRAFAVEARAIHDGETPARSIYGEATREEVSALLDDGIPLLPMPVLPDDHH